MNEHITPNITNNYDETILSSESRVENRRKERRSKMPKLNLKLRNEK